MTKVCPIWKPLPFEILHYIFRLIPNKSLYDLLLVCKNWVQPAQAVLYTNVAIRSLTQFEKFYDVVQMNNNLGLYVKEFSFDFSSRVMDEHVKKETIDSATILLSIYLPNLEALSVFVFASYIPVINALQNSRLKYLKRISSPLTVYIINFDLHDIEEAYYVKCVLLLKDRLENLSIKDDCKFRDRTLNFNHMYEKLNQFSEVKEIEIFKTGEDGIQILEYVLEACKAINMIKFHNFPSHGNALNRISIIDEISTFVPRNNIKKFRSLANYSIDDRILAYIMHKFPRLFEFNLWANTRQNPFQIDQRILTRLLFYVHKINSFSVIGLGADQNDVAIVFENFWKETSTFGSEEVKIRYRAYHGGTLDIKKSKVPNKLSTTLFYSTTTDSVMQHAGFTEKTGRFIGRLQLSFCTGISNESEKFVSLRNFMVHTLTNCPNLRFLKLEQCFFIQSTSPVFIQSSSPEIGHHSNKFSLDELTLSHCSVQAGAMEQLSLILSEIRRVVINDVIQFVNEEDAGIMAKSDFIMPNTKIGSIIIKDFPYAHLKVFVPRGKKCYYYRHNPSNRKNQVLVSNEQEYMKAHKFKRVYLSCRTKPKIEII